MTEKALRARIPKAYNALAVGRDDRFSARVQQRFCDQSHDIHRRNSGQEKPIRHRRQAIAGRELSFIAALAFDRGHVPREGGFQHGFFVLGDNAIEIVAINGVKSDRSSR